MIGEPPLDVGAVHCINTEVKVLSTLTGAPGAVGRIAITSGVGLEGILDPMSLTAITMNS